MPYRKIIAAITFLLGVVIFFVQCIGKSSQLTTNDPRGNSYAGSVTCMSCHKDIANSYAHTNHFRTSSLPNRDELRRLMNGSGNEGHYADLSTAKVEEKDSGFYQYHVSNGKIVRSGKMDIAFGSGEKAQTYGYWSGTRLFELPLTWFASEQTWTNSPGFPAEHPYFDRVIPSRCFECHASYISKTDVASGPLQMTEQLNASTIVYGIDCERCHGPAAEHVQFHQQNPDVKKAMHIGSIQALARQRQLDLCASCHSGNDLGVQRTLFAFKPGDSLSNFYYPDFGPAPAEPDVHGKQMQLLRASKCFQLSTMTCTTCHNTHETEENKMNVFTGKCVDCHGQSTHAVEMKTAGKSCIDCHMPLQASKSLEFNNGSQTKSLTYYLRTHRIAIYDRSITTPPVRPIMLSSVH